MFTQSPDHLGSLRGEVVIIRLHSVGEGGDPRSGCHWAKPRGARNREAAWGPGCKGRDLWLVTL